MTSRALVVGLDGMPLTLLHQLVERGVTPRLGELLARSACTELVAPVPEISSTSWASFLTGVNPGRHGVYGFVDLVPGSYRTFFPTVEHLTARPVWEHAADAGLRTACLNVPGTYPAPDIAGVLVAGFVAPRLERAVSPARLVGPLRGLGYELDVEVGDVAADPAGFVRRATRCLDARVRAFRRLLTGEPWDLALAVFTETDRFQHFLWSEVEPEPTPTATGFYRRVDDAVGELLDVAGDAATFLVSDHGFGPAHLQFPVNPWLRGRGLLSDTGRAPALGSLDAGSRVFALDPARFYLHRRDRFPRGTLTDQDADDLAAELAAELAALRVDGDRVAPGADGPPLLDAVYRARDVYSGPGLGGAPDLVAVPARGVQLRGAWERPPGPDVFTGTHTRGGAVFAVPAPARPGPRVDMQDVAPTVLGALGVRPAGLDGRDVTAGHTTTGSLDAVGRTR